MSEKPTTARPRPTLSPAADSIFDEVLDAMQAAEELGGPADYSELMLAIAREAQRRNAIHLMSGKTIRGVEHIDAEPEPAFDGPEVDWRVEYQIATYRGTITVRASENADRDHVIGLAEAALARKSGQFPLGMRSYNVERA